MRVLIISRYFWPEDGVSEEPYILKEYVDWHLIQGHKIEVISGAQNHHKDDLKVYENLGVKFSYFLAQIDRKSNFYMRILNSLFLLILAIKSIIFNKKFDLIYLPSNPPILALLVMIFNKLLLKKSKTIFTVQDNMIYRLKNNFFKNIYKIYMKYTLNISNIIIVLSQPMKDEISSYFSLKKLKQISKKIHILLNFSNNIDKNLFQQREFSPKSIDIIYAGNHGESQSLTSFLRVLIEINPNEQPSVVFYGEGTDKINVLNFAKKHHLNINFNDPIPKKEIIEKISKSKYGLVCMSESLSRYAFPSKLATYLSSGTKVILCVNGYDYLSDFIKDNEFGYVIDSSDPKSAASNLKKYLKNSKQSNLNFFHNIDHEFNKENYFKKLSKILEL